MKRLIIILLFISTDLFAQFEPDSIIVLLEFSEPMDSTELYIEENYMIVGSSGDTLQIYSIGNIEGVDSIVAILASSLNYDSEYYTVYVDDVYDLARNKINYLKRFAFYDFKMKDIQMVNNVKVEK